MKLVSELKPTKMLTTWPRFNIDSQFNYSLKKTHVVHLVRSTQSRILLAAQIERNHQQGIVSNTIKYIDLSAQDKRSYYYSRHDQTIIPHDNARPHVAVTWKHLIGESYPSRSIHQTMSFLMITCSDRCQIDSSYVLLYLLFLIKYFYININII